MNEPTNGYAMYDLRVEVGRMRKRDVDRRVIARIDAVEGEATTEQIEQWESDAYRLWRETWPALNSLLIPHGSLAEAPDASAEAHAHG